MSPARPSHYSYTHYADPATAREFDERRFGGPIGQMVAATQARVVTDFIGNLRSQRILDVGTGTGRAAVLLARGGAEVTGVDPSEQMLSVARQRAGDERLDIAFHLGDAHALAFPDRAFDAVVSLRVLMHTRRWRHCLSELCRVADRLVVLDYPSASSAAALEAAGRRVLHSVGVATEPYRVLTLGRVSRVLNQSGFRVRNVHRQFVLPIALHKAIGAPSFTTSIESSFERVGLLRLFGSPVTLVAERCQIS